MKLHPTPDGLKFPMQVMGPTITHGWLDANDLSGLRQLAGLTVADVATKMNGTAKQVYSVEAGNEFYITPNKLRRLLALFGQELEDVPVETEGRLL